MAESSKYLDDLKQYNTNLNDADIKEKVEKIIAEKFQENNT